jgi:murein DD-endopeptidase MepM/ murein hydrolase activator NlpD
MQINRVITLILFIGGFLLLPAASDPPPMAADAQQTAELRAALEDRLQTVGENQPLTVDLFTPQIDAAFLSPDENSAAVWLALQEPSGRIVAAEPGLALAQKSPAGWQLLLPGDPGWDALFQSMPANLIPAELSPAPDNLSLDAQTNALTGYYLPYTAGTSHFLEGSISHFQSIPALGYPSCTEEYCHYAYDFTDYDHFPLVASKEGTVVSTRDSCTDGNPNCTNYIVLRTSGDQTYQIYIHLAYGTIPDKLTNGTLVKRGQYLGDSDDTGYSTSQHVHFMVTNSIWVGGDGYYWGRSIDVRFADVSINNGIPRNCYEVTRFPIYDGASDCLGNKADPLNPANDWFISGNTGAYPPTAVLTRPAAGAAVTSGTNPIMDVTATVSDDVRVTAAQLLAKVNGAWVEIGPRQSAATANGELNWDVNLCEAGGFNGALEVSLRVWDHEGNVASGLSARTIQVDHACPPPSSQLSGIDHYDSSAVLLNWSAADAGAGLGSFEIQWRTDPGAWQSGNAMVFSGFQRSAWFSGQPGTAYAFRFRALDKNGQAEAWPAGDAAEGSASLPATCVADSAEPDDSAAQAQTLQIGVTRQANFCPSANADWYTFQITEADQYLLKAQSVDGGAAARINLFAADGVTLLKQSAAPAIGQDAYLQYGLPAGTYLFQIEPLTTTLQGTQAIYGLHLAPGRLMFLPVIAR